MLNISVDTLRPERFEQMTRRRGHDRVMDAIHNAIQLGYDPVKVGHPLFTALGQMELGCEPHCGLIACRAGLETDTSHSEQAPLLRH